MNSTGFLLLSGILQPSLVGYAWRLNRVFGSGRVGWWLVAVFACLGLLQLAHALPLLGLSLGLLDFLIPVLLLVGMAHTEFVWVARQRLEHTEQKLQAQLQRTTEQCEDLIAANQNLVHQLIRREQREKALTTSEQQLRFLFAENPLPMWVFDLRSLRFLAVNEAALRQYGYSATELAARSAKELYAPADVPAFLQTCANASSGPGASGFCRHRRKDGTLLEVEVRSVDCVYDGCPARLVVAQNVTWLRALHPHHH